jgi:RNA polymerase sigma-70 factor (ECF subfamily)
MIVLVLPDITADELLLKKLNSASDADLGTVISDIYERYFTPIYHFVRLRVGDVALAEDITSDIFVTLIECLGTSSAPRKHLRGWLFKVARNAIAQHIGKIRRLSLAELEEWMPAPDSNPENQIHDIFERKQLYHAMQMLTPEHQEVLLLRFGQRLSIQDTADIMGKSISAIKSLQFRAMSNLRQILTGGDAVLTTQSPTQTTSFTEARS